MEFYYLHVCLKIFLEKHNLLKFVQIMYIWFGGIGVESLAYTKGE